MKNKKELLIFGAGGHAVKVAKIATFHGNYKLLGYISTERQGTAIDDSYVLGYIDFYKNTKDIHKVFIHIGIGENSIRYKIYHEIGELNKKIISIISDWSIVSKYSTIDKGCFVAQGVIIQNNVKVGKCCIIDTGAVIDHDNTIGDFVTISPNSTICSHVSIGNGAIIGAGSTIIEKTKIGENSLVGAGSVVIKDIPPNVVVVGNPARIIRKREFNERYFKQ